MMSESDIDINMDKSMAIGHSSPTHQKRQISNFELATSEPAGRVTVGRSSAARRANIPSLRTREINQNAKELTRHRETESCRVSYKCKVQGCKAQFFRSFYFRKHMRRDHPDVPWPALRRYPPQRSTLTPPGSQNEIKDLSLPLGTPQGMSREKKSVKAMIREAITTAPKKIINTQPTPMETEHTPQTAGKRSEARIMGHSSDDSASSETSDRMEQVEWSSLLSAKSTWTTFNATGNDGSSQVEAESNILKDLIKLGILAKVDDPIFHAESLDHSDEEDSEKKEPCLDEMRRDVDDWLDEMRREDDESSEDDENHAKSTLNTAMNGITTLLVQELLDYALLEDTDAQDGTGSSSSGSSVGGVPGDPTDSSPPAGASTSQTRRRMKRMRGSEQNSGDGNGDGDDSDDDGRPKKTNKTDISGQVSQRRLKCPFFQRQPEKYRKAACRGEGFVDMEKLKDHIKRVHTQPLRCSRCWLEMASDAAYSKHLRQNPICEMKEEPHDDRIRQETLKQLEFKKAPYASARNMEEKWNILFRVLFPNDTKIPSPYEQHGMDLRLEQALSEALVEELTHELAPYLEPIMSRIKERVPIIIENCRRKLARSATSPVVEIISTPSATATGSSAHKSTSSERFSSGPGIPTECRFSGSNPEFIAHSAVLSSKAQGKQPLSLTNPPNKQYAGTSHDTSSSESSTDMFTAHSEVPAAIPMDDDTNVDNCFDIGDSSRLFNACGHFLSDDQPRLREDIFTTSADKGEASFREEGGQIQETGKQTTAQLPDSQSCTCPFGEGGFQDSTCAQPAGEQLYDPWLWEPNPPLDWDFVMKHVEFSHHNGQSGTE